MYRCYSRRKDCDISGSGIAIAVYKCRRLHCLSVLNFDGLGRYVNKQKRDESSHLLLLRHEPPRAEIGDPLPWCHSPFTISTSNITITIHFFTHPSPPNSGAHVLSSPFSFSSSPFHLYFSLRLFIVQLQLI